MIISMPLYVVMGFKRKKDEDGNKVPNIFYFNLNAYRNWHYQVSNKLKARYKAILAPKVEGMTFGRMSLTFTLHRADKRRVDRSNILSIHEKFFCDGLTECGCIKDDCDEFLESSHYYTGNIDKANPRVDIELKEIGI